MNTSKYFTPLRYPGGKGKLSEYVKQIIISNNLSGCSYVEVYAGGAAVALELLLLDYVDDIHINDLNPGVYAFWHEVINNTAALIDKIRAADISMDEWYLQKAIQSKANSTILELAFSTFFLNRCNRSGILKAGVIGGKKQDGKWKLDARFNKEDLIARIEQIGRNRDRITLTNTDALELLTSFKAKKLDSMLIYLDPPYYVKGKGLYDNFYDHEDHLHIAQAVTGLANANWIVSYDDVPEITLMYQLFRNLRYRLSYSAQSREQGGEIMFYSNSLLIPDIPAGRSMHIAA